MQDGQFNQSKESLFYTPNVSLNNYSNLLCQLVMFITTRTMELVNYYTPSEQNDTFDGR